MSKKYSIQEMTSIGQGVFYLATGIWPWLSRRTFESVTGPKRDWWLVQTVGLLITVIGGITLWAGWKQRVTPEVQALGAGSAASLAAVDILFTAQKRISPIYLLDAAAEIGLMGLWALGLVSKRK